MVGGRGKYLLFAGIKAANCKKGKMCNFAYLVLFFIAEGSCCVMKLFYAYINGKCISLKIEERFCKMIALFNLLVINT